MQFGLQVERQEFGTLGFHDGNILQGDDVLEAPCFVVAKGFVVLGDVGPGNRSETITDHLKLGRLTHQAPRPRLAPAAVRVPQPRLPGRSPHRVERAQRR